jgi:hypothetical protein
MEGVHMVSYLQICLHFASSAQVEHMGVDFDFGLQGSKLPGAGLAITPRYGVSYPQISTITRTTGSVFFRSPISISRRKLS